MLSPAMRPAVFAEALTETGWGIRHLIDRQGIGPGRSILIHTSIFSAFSIFGNALSGAVFVLPQLEQRLEYPP
jgi:hypothetical protein